MKRRRIECIFEFKYNLKLINILMGIFFSKNNGESPNNNNFGEKNNYFETLKSNINVSFQKYKSRLNYLSGRAISTYAHKYQTTYTSHSLWR